MQCAKATGISGCGVLAAAEQALRREADGGRQAAAVKDQHAWAQAAGGRQAACAEDVMARPQVDADRPNKAPPRAPGWLQATSTEQQHQKQQKQQKQQQQQQKQQLQPPLPGASTATASMHASTPPWLPHAEPAAGAACFGAPAISAAPGPALPASADSAMPLQPPFALGALMHGDAHAVHSSLAQLQRLQHVLRHSSGALPAAGALVLPSTQWPQVALPPNAWHVHAAAALPVATLQPADARPAQGSALDAEEAMAGSFMNCSSSRGGVTGAALHAPHARADMHAARCAEDAPHPHMWLGAPVGTAPAHICPGPQGMHALHTGAPQGMHAEGRHAGGSLASAAYAPFSHAQQPAEDASSHSAGQAAHAPPVRARMRSLPGGAESGTADAAGADACTRSAAATAAHADEVMRGHGAAGRGVSSAGAQAACAGPPAVSAAAATAAAPRMSYASIASDWSAPPAATAAPAPRGVPGMHDERASDGAEDARPDAKAPARAPKRGGGRERPRRGPGGARKAGGDGGGRRQRGAEGDVLQRTEQARGPGPQHEQRRAEGGGNAGSAEGRARRSWGGRGGANRRRGAQDRARASDGAP
jgi:hypothetical protein